MCLIVLNWQPDAACPLVMAANRDEFYARPTSALQVWPDRPIVAGQDLQAGGTWLGTSAQGRVAALTNYRDPRNHRPEAPSRGDLVTAFLDGHASAQDYLAELRERAADFNPFNLIVFDGHSLWGFESRHRRAFALPPGVNAVSNADFQVPWPKLTRLRQGFAAVLERTRQAEHAQLQSSTLADCFALLAERRRAPVADLPDTGLSVAREQALSAEFIHTAEYGTRASTVLVRGHHTTVVVERSFDATGPTGEVRQVVHLPTPQETA